jgi:hypothetical protein
MAKHKTNENNENESSTEEIKTANLIEKLTTNPNKPKTNPK